MKMIDIAANLTDPMFKGIYRGKHVHQNDLHLVIQRAKDIGLENIIITGTTLEDSKEALQIAHDFNLFSTCGCHPTRSLEFQKEGYFENLSALLLKDSQSPKPRIVAVGECGLDYDRLQFCPKDDQKVHISSINNIDRIFKAICACKTVSTPHVPSQ